jgi:hypothetical protein
MTMTSAPSGSHSFAPAARLRATTVKAWPAAATAHRPHRRPNDEQDRRRWVRQAVRHSRERKTTRLPRAFKTRTSAMATWVLPVPPAVRFPTHTTRATERKGEALRLRPYTDNPYSAPKGDSSMPHALALPESLVQNSGACMAQEVCAMRIVVASAPPRARRQTAPSGPGGQLQPDCRSMLLRAQSIDRSTSPCLRLGLRG